MSDARLPVVNDVGDDTDADADALHAVIDDRSMNGDKTMREIDIMLIADARDLDLPERRDERAVDAERKADTVFLCIHCIKCSADGAGLMAVGR